MQNIIDTDYQVVQERTPEVIRTEIKTIEAQVYKTTMDGVIQIGNRLQELKEMVGHGNWIQWCKENLGYSDRQAQRYMELSEQYGNEDSPFSNPTLMSDLSITKAYSLLALPEKEVEEFVEEHDIADMTVKKLEAEIQEWKSKTESLQDNIDTMAAEYEAMKKAADEKEAALKTAQENEVDPKEIARLEMEVEKEKGKLKKAKEALKKEQEAKTEAIEAAVEEKKAELLQKAEAAQADKIKAAEESKAAMEQQLAEAKKKLKLSNNTAITTVKVKLDLIQKTFMDIDVAIDNIGLEDKEQGAKLRTATRQIMQSLIDRLEG